MAVQQTTVHGLTVAFGTTSYAPIIRSIGWSGLERGAVDNSHVGLTDHDSGISAFMEWIPRGWIDGGEIQFEIIWGHDKEPPISKAAETITITFVGTGTVGQGSLAFSGFVTGFTMDGTDEDGYVGTVTVKIAGGYTWTDPS